MTKRKVRYKDNDIIVPCPKCRNSTEFTVISNQFSEDCCEVWAVCKCGYDPSSDEEAGNGYRVEDVWGGCSDENCQDALLYAWNEAIESMKSCSQ